LCAGYGTRLQRDLVEDASRKHLVHLPKALLPVGNEPLLTHWIRQIGRAFPNDLDRQVEIVLVTNDKFLEQFIQWSNATDEDNEDDRPSLDAENLRPKIWSGKVEGLKVNIVSDGTASNETRTGAVACIKLGMDLDLDLDLDYDKALVVAGDTLFRSDFDLSSFVSSFEARQKIDALITACPTPEEEMHLRGIIETAENSGKVTRLLEKPSPEMTSSRSQCPCFYLFEKRRVLPVLDGYLGNDGAGSFKDATGSFLAHLIQEPDADVFSHQISGRFDIGNLKLYIECCEQFGKY